jgi:RNA polymerase sigma-70 factor (ECF subfamily)
VRRRVGSEDCEDIIQDSYLRLLELENSEKIVDLRGYLFRIASNMAIDWPRRRRIRMAYLVEGAEFDEATCEDFAGMRAVEIRSYCSVCSSASRSCPSSVARCCCSAVYTA